jgi:hypothetical protein
VNKLREATNFINAAILSMRDAGRLFNTEINTAMGANSVEPIIFAFDALRECNDKIKEITTILNIMEARVSSQCVPDLFKLRKVKNINIEGVGRVSIGRRWSCSILNGQKANAYKWLRDGGNGALITETINGQTLGAFAHDLSDTKGLDMPDKLFKTSINPYTSITK